MMLEQELKLTAQEPAVLDQVLQQSVVRQWLVSDIAAAARHFHAIYYDTEALILEAGRCSLRARCEGDAFRAAFKLPGEIIDGLSSREEFEVDIQDWLQSVDDLPESPLKDQVIELIPSDSKLIERVVVEMQRRIYHLQDSGSDIELVLDHGRIRGTDGEIVLCEVELELKRGDVADVLAIGKALESALPLTRSSRSKHRIGLDLCNRRHEH